MWNIWIADSRLLDFSSMLDVIRQPPFHDNSLRFPICEVPFNQREGRASVDENLSSKFGTQLGLLDDVSRKLELPIRRR